jgi:hypothetical protein
MPPEMIKAGPDREGFTSSADPNAHAISTAVDVWQVRRLYRAADRTQAYCTDMQDIL